MSKKITLSLVGAALVVIGVWWALSNISALLGVVDFVLGVFSALILGTAIAFVLNLPMSFFERHLFKKSIGNPKMFMVRRGISLFMSILIIILVIIFVMLLVIPEFVNAVILLGESLVEVTPEIVDWIVGLTSGHSQFNDFFNNLSIDWDTLTQNVVNYMTVFFSDLLVNTMGIATSLAGSVTNVIFAFIFAMYILTGKERLGRQFTKLFRAILPEKALIVIRVVLKKSQTIFSKYIVAQCTEVVILSTLTFIGMTIFGFPYPTTISVLIGLLAFIPLIGAFTGAVVGAFLVFTVDPIQAVWFLIFFIILQQFEGNLIYPRVVGGSLGIQGIWVLAAVTIGGSLGGILGMLIAAPVFSIIYSFVAVMANESIKLQERDETVKHNPITAIKALLISMEEDDKREKAKQKKED